MSFTIATGEDIPALCELLAILFTQEAEFAPDAKKQTAALAAIIGDPAVGTILTYRQDGKIIGMVNLLFTVSTFLGTKVALLEDMVIHPDHRNQGAGARLLQAAIHHATGAGCSRITLLTDGTNADAARFYERMGFVKSGMTPFRLSLPC